MESRDSKALTTALAGLSAVSIGAAGLLWHLWRTEDAAKKTMEESYWAERRGRTRVEQEMRNLANIQLNTDAGFFVQPMGVVESCYRQCVGTPRQGLLAPQSRAAVLLSSNMSAESMDGLEDFSHVWLTFKFHLNTNSLKEAKAFDGRKYTFTAKITPPMLKEKKGVLATRSPHRPNPFGVTLAKIDRVDKKSRRLYVTACDLVNGTPILDIKPYVPVYDTTPDSKIPQWIVDTVHTRNTVTVASDVPEKVGRLAKKLKQYKNDPGAFLSALVETLEADVRSKFQTKKGMADASKDVPVPVDVPFDETTVYYLWKDLRSFEVVDVKLTRDTAKKDNYLSYGLSTAERTVAE
eukprot:GSChrysophyteH2.ASY1.ANO1.916.1 assembled CDS